MILNTEHIKQVLTGYFQKKPVKKVWLFGSYARGEATDSSDVDVLVEIDYNALNGLDYFGWKDELSDKLHKNIDIVSAGWENKYVKPFIDKDKFVIYER